MNKNLAIAIGESVVNLGVACTGTAVIGKKLENVINNPKIAKNQKVGWAVGATLLYTGVYATWAWINTKIWDNYVNKEYEAAVSEYNSNAEESEESEKTEDPEYSVSYAGNNGLGVISEALAEKIKKSPEMTMDELENL